VETRELVDAISAAENARDWERLGALFSDQVTIVHPGIGPVVGRDANLGIIRFIVAAISGYTRTVENLIVKVSRARSASRSLELTREISRVTRPRAVLSRLPGQCSFGCLLVR
jgi:hypothetical protein